MTTKGRPTGAGGAGTSGNEGAVKVPRGRARSVSQEERPFDPGQRAESHRRAARAPRAGRAATGGAKSPRRSSSRAKQEALPFDGLPDRLMARLRPERFTRRLIQLGVALLGLLLAGALLMVVYHLSHGLRIFDLREVVVRRTGSGEKLISDEEIREIVRRQVQEGVIRLDLEAVRAELRRHELIREVEVRRLLPDTVSVTISERVPFALARPDNEDPKCVDQDGTLFGSASLYKARPIPPFIRGLRQVAEQAEDVERREAAAFNRVRLAAYQSLIADLDRIEPPLSAGIDEIYFDDVDGARVILANSGIAVHLGREDFRQRLNSALDILDAVKRKDLESLRLLRLGYVEKMLSDRRVKYVNATDQSRIIVGFDE